MVNYKKKYLKYKTKYLIIKGGTQPCPPSCPKNDTYFNNIGKGDWEHSQTDKVRKARLQALNESTNEFNKRAQTSNENPKNDKAVAPEPKPTIDTYKISLKQKTIAGKRDLDQQSEEWNYRIAMDRAYLIKKMGKAAGEKVEEKVKKLEEDKPKLQGDPLDEDLSVEEFEKQKKQLQEEMALIQKQKETLALDKKAELLKIIDDLKTQMKNLENT